MASIINAVRNILGDDYWHVKIIIYSIPIFFIINNKLQNYLNPVAYILPACIYIGICCYLMNKNINNKSPILPSLFDIPELIQKIILGSIIEIPLLLVYVYVLNLIIKNFTYSTAVMYVILGCISMILVPFILMPLVYFSVRDNIFDALNIKKIIDGAGNFAVAFLAFVIQYVLLFGFVGSAIYLLIFKMLNDEFILNIFISIFIVFSILTLYSYCSNLYSSEIPALNTKR